uniref:ferroxidase n=1 Tax=Schistosoma japonicum TaxID=6182 RepID=C1LKK7_SCHJA|nr:Frataxin homolog, mitochondrial precursor [Schistosoma japonicum]
MRYNVPFPLLRKYGAFLNSFHVPFSFCSFCNNHFSKIGFTKLYCTDSLSGAEYERVSTRTLESLAETFEQLPEQFPLTKEYDVEHAYGVLKVIFGPSIGTYIINRQAPNKQLWLSSPISGPKRYDYVPSVCLWIYKHDGKSLHSLLSEEISTIVGGRVEFQS